LYSQLSQQYNVSGLEKAVNDYDAQIALEQQYLLESKRFEKGKPVPMNIIEGRVNEQEVAAMDRIDFWGRQKNRAVNQLNSAYKVIDTMITLTGQDYEMASNAYDRQFNQNLQVYQAFTQTKEFQVNTAFKLADFEMTQIQNEQNAARANLQIYSNLLTGGNVAYANLPSDTKLAISKLETISGLGVGFLSSIQSDNPGGKIISTTTREDANGNKYADVILQNPDGSFKIVSQSLGSVKQTGGGTAAASGYTQTQYNSLVTKAEDVLKEVDIQGRKEAHNLMIDGVEASDEDYAKMKEDDYYLSDEEAFDAYNRIIAMVGDEELGEQIFWQAFKSGGFRRWVDPNAPQTPYKEHQEMINGQLVTVQD
jgi:hypothetical protein